MYRQKEKVDDAYPLHRMRKKQMEHTWTKEFYQETDPAKRQQILKEHIGEEEAWEEEYRTRLWAARYGQRRLQKDEFVRCLMELKYLAEGTSLDPGGDRRKMGARILSTLCLAEAMQSEKGYQKILEDELYNVFLKFIQVSRGGRGFTSLVFGMGQLSEEGIAKKIAEQISVIAFKAPRLLRMEKEFTLLREAALRAYRQEYPNREHFLNKY